MTPLRIAQWNARSIFRKLPELKRFINTQNPQIDILCIQETHLTHMYTPRIAGYTLVRKDRTSQKGGGICIFIKNTLSYNDLNLVNPVPWFEIQGITTCGINILNIYIPPNNHVQQHILSDIFNQFSSRTLILGDFNARNTHWNNSSNNCNGLRLANVLDDTNFVLLNDSQYTRYPDTTIGSHHASPSLIDLNIASPDLAPRCVTSVVDVYLDSDHSIIFTDIDTHIMHNNIFRPRWSLKRADWKKFNDHITMAIPQIKTDMQSVNDLNCSFITSISNAAQSSIPRTKATRHVPVPWWTEECSRAVALKRKAYSKLRRSFAMRDSIAFKKARASCRLTILQAKRNYWQSYCSSLNSHSRISDVWKMYYRVSRNFTPQIPPLHAPDTVTKLNILAQHFSYISSNENFES